MKGKRSGFDTSNGKGAYLYVGRPVPVWEQRWLATANNTTDTEEGSHQQ